MDVPFNNSRFLKEGKWLPPYIFQSDYKACQTDERDIISPDARQMMKMQGIRENLLPQTKENWSEFVSLFEPNLVTVNDLSLKYVPAGIAVPDESLERVGTLNLLGRKGLEIYNDLVVARLKKFRNA